MKSLPFALLFCLLLAFASFAPAAEDLKLWYDHPAKDWQQQALPIGNGRLAAMIYGTVPEEHIQFNEESFWIGDEQDTGAYQNAGDLYIKFDHSGEVKNYRRQLNLEYALHSIDYESGGVKFHRGASALQSENVLMFHFSADKSESLSGSIRLTDAHGGKVLAENDRITSSGSLAGYRYEGNRPYKIALNYEMQALVGHSGGTLQADGSQIRFRNASSIWIYFDAGTDFIRDRRKGWRGDSPHRAISDRLAKAVERSYADMGD